MIWDWLVQRTGKYCSIRRIEYTDLKEKTVSSCYCLESEAKESWRQPSLLRPYRTCWEESHLDATRERHVIPLNSEEGTIFLNVILRMAYSKLYRESGQQDGTAGLNFVGTRTIGCSIQSFFWDQW